MALNRFQHKDCAITVSAIFLSGPRKWRPQLFIVRLCRGAARAREQAVVDQPAIFQSANEALEFGRLHACQLVDGALPGLRV
jgi:hypothetical protein